MLSKPDLASLEKTIQNMVKGIIERFRTAPAPTEKPPCVVMIAPMLSEFQSYMTAIAQDHTASTGSFLMRSNYGALLDALVIFASSTWTVGERVAFEKCDCERHSADDFQNFYREISELRDDRKEYRTSREIVIQVFRILASVASDIHDNDGEIIRLEKKRKRGKWPSSPSQFIPRGAAAAVSASMEWARLAEHPAPLDALCQMASCSSSLLSAMNKEKTLFPLFNALFSQHISRLRQLDFINISARSINILELDINDFLSVFRSDWFHKQIAFAGSVQTGARSLTPLYHMLCTFIPLLETMNFRMLNIKKMTVGLGYIALTIRSWLTTFAPVPLDPVLVPFVPIYDQASSPYATMLDAVALRNQQKCAEALCLRTGESTKSNFKQCSGCQAVRYCSKECQVVDWKEHKGACKLLKVVTPIALLQYHGEPGIATPEITNAFYDKIRRAGMTEQDMAHVCRYINDHTGVILNRDISGEYMLA